MRITRLTTKEYAPFYSLRLESLGVCPEEFATDADAWKNAPRETIHKLLDNSEERNDMPILGAWDGDILVGLIGAKRELRPTVSHKITLWGWYVTPAHRRQGLGQALLDETIKILKNEPDLRLIRAVVTVTSRSALSLLETQGFKIYGREPEAKKLDDKFLDQVYLWFPLYDLE